MGYATAKTITMLTCGNHKIAQGGFRCNITLLRTGSGRVFSDTSPVGNRSRLHVITEYAFSIVLSDAPIINHRDIKALFCKTETKWNKKFRGYATQSYAFSNQGTVYQ